MSNNIVLKAKSVSKFFGTITALNNVDLELNEGEVLGVVGDNGAGKSTLMKVLSGLYKPSEGSLFFDNKNVILNSPRDSQNLGLEMVYQDLALAGNLPIGDNIFLGREPTKKIGPFNFLDHKKRKELTEEHLAKLKINVKSADQKVDELSGGQRQAVAIARATAFNAKIVIMDEPTAALAVKEVGKVLDLILNLKKMGVSIIVISHRMDDIFSVCDRVMALFQGTNFAEAPLNNTSRDEVIGWIMGKKD
mgnify:FL=1|tara:strand:- start:19825 stop:20571 length:747 start_codon:yes stop_codon:yes gene_type:complete